MLVKLLDVYSLETVSCYRLSASTHTYKFLWKLEMVYFNSDVRKSVHHHTIQINQPTRCNCFTSLLLDVYVWLNMFLAPFRPSSGAYNWTRSLWFTVGGWRLVLCWSWSGRPRPTTQQTLLSNGKTRGS